MQRGKCCWATVCSRAALAINPGNLQKPIIQYQSHRRWLLSKSEMILIRTQPTLSVPRAKDRTACSANF